jgi:hypothetical protein
VGSRVILCIRGRLLGEEFVALYRVGIRELTHRRMVCVDNEQVVHPTPKNSIDEHLAPFDADNSAGTRVCGFRFRAGPVAKDHDDLLLLVCANQGFKSLDPVDQCLDIGFCRVGAKYIGILMCLPGHGYYHQVCLCFDYVKTKLEGVPGGFEFVRTVMLAEGYK